MVGGYEEQSSGSRNAGSWLHHVLRLPLLWKLVLVDILISLFAFGLVRGAARVRALAAQVIRAGDKERARIARELHDSTAQALGALDLLLTATMRERRGGSRRA